MQIEYLSILKVSIVKQSCTFVSRFELIPSNFSSKSQFQLCEANNEVCLLKSEIAKPLDTVKEADSLKEQHQKKQSGNIKQTSDHKSIENLTSIQKQPSGMKDAVNIKSTKNVKTQEGQT